MDPNTTPPSDGGPVYAETDLARTIAEPWNAASAAVFLLIVLFWAVRLRGRYRQVPFLSACLPILTAGGIGGTLYHAFRSSYVFFLLDVVPIGLLCALVSLFLWARLNLRWYHLIIILLLFLGLNQAARLGTTTQQSINVSYGLLACIILAPMSIVLIRTRFRHGGWIALALPLFAAALFFRYADGWQPPLLSMGTHWLWHLCGAASCAALAEYVYRLELERA